MKSCSGHPALSQVQQSLEAEIAMARWIDQNLEMTVQRYMQREAAGMKSGV